MITKLVNSYVGWVTSFPVSVAFTPATLPSKQTAQTAAEHKQEVSSLNLNFSLHAFPKRWMLCWVISPLDEGMDLPRLAWIFLKVFSIHITKIELKLSSWILWGLCCCIFELYLLGLSPPSAPLPTALCPSPLCSNLDLFISCDIEYFGYYHCPDRLPIAILAQFNHAHGN